MEDLGFGLRPVVVTLVATECTELSMVALG